MLGLDIGGSSSRARLRGYGAQRDVQGLGANVATLDPNLVEERVGALIANLGEIELAACCAGAAGAELPEARARLESLLHRLLPGARVCVVHDARLVLAAAGLDSGIALIAGTGSVAYGRASGGREVQRGGWGWMLGDEGSAVWITREAARLVMTRGERGHSIGQLGDSLLRATEAADPRQMVARLHALHEPMRWAELASVVFATAQADAGSREIVRRAGTELAKLAASTGMTGPIVLAGGVLLHQPELERVVRASLPQFQCIRLEAPPVEGAVRLAEELLRG